MQSNNVKCVDFEINFVHNGEEGCVMVSYNIEVPHLMRMLTHYVHEYYLTITPIGLTFAMGVLGQTSSTVQGSSFLC